MTTRHSRGLVLGILVATAPLLAACPVPVSGTQVDSSPVEGRLVREDGRPIANAEVAVSTDWRDSVCGTPRITTRTDDRGQFALPATTHQYKVVWVIPNLDRAPPGFELCAEVDDALRAAYRGRGSLGDGASIDSVECIAWTWQEQPRVSCNGRRAYRRAIATGGEWVDSATAGARGFYRLFLTSEPTVVKGYKESHPQGRPYVYVQWVEQNADTGAAAARYRVRTTVSLPLDRNKVWAVESMQLWQREGHWLASLHGYKHAFMNDVASTEIVFELGQPGQAKQVVGP